MRRRLNTIQITGHIFTGVTSTLKMVLSDGGTVQTVQERILIMESLIIINRLNGFYRRNGFERDLLDIPQIMRGATIRTTVLCGDR